MIINMKGLLQNDQIVRCTSLSYFLMMNILKKIRFLAIFWHFHFFNNFGIFKLSVWGDFWNQFQN